MRPRQFGVAVSLRSNDMSISGVGDGEEATGIDRRDMLASAFGALLAGAAASPVAASPADEHRDAHPNLLLDRDDKQKNGVYPPCDPALKAEIEAVLKRTAELWNAQEWGKIPHEIWDREDASPMYVAEELYDVIIGWARLDRYIFPEKKNLDAFRWGYANLWVKELAPGVVLALYDHWFEIKLGLPPQVPASRPRAGFDRVLSIYRRTPNGWRQSLYAQCPLGPDTYIRKALETLVQPDFPEFLDNVKKMKIDDPRLKKS
jgi:hypothetical protein